MLPDFSSEKWFGEHSGGSFGKRSNATKVRKHCGSNFADGGNVSKVQKQFAKYSGSIAEAISITEEIQDKSGSNSENIPEANSMTEEMPKKQFTTNYVKQKKTK